MSLAALVSGCGGGGHGTGTQEIFGSEVLDDVPGWVKAERLPAAAIPGAKLFAVSGCTVCHTYLDSGSTALNAPDLTAIGTKQAGVESWIRYLEDPAAVTEGSSMPRFDSLGKVRLRRLAIFLEASKGKR